MSAIRGHPPSSQDIRRYNGLIQLFLNPALFFVPSYRVGRTGRAGNKGTAITFIGPDEDRYAPDLVKALKESKAAVPQDLQALADSFAAKRNAGLVQGHGSGYGGSGFKFDKEEDNKVKAARKSKAKVGVCVENLLIMTVVAGNFLQLWG